MIDIKVIHEIIDEYDTKDVKIGVIGSHSALDVCEGAISEEFRTFVVCQKGREKTYTHYFRTIRENSRVVSGVVDEIMILDKFREVMKSENQEILRKNNVLFIPNRSFTSYVNISEIEDSFSIPLVGSRNMLRMEERTEKKNYYWLLEKANLPYPEKIDNHEEIDELCVVKLKHKMKKLERGFFTVSSYEEYKTKSEQLIKQNVITEDDLQTARIERYIIGPVFNIDMFYSPLDDKLELLGIDWRFESSLDGHVRLPAQQQLTLPEKQKIPEYTVCGHNSATLRESLLEKVFEMGEKFVKASKEHYSPGIIGPFCLQTCVDKDLNFYIYDIAPRIGGGTNIHTSVGHPYGNTLWRKNMSTGRRIAFEIKRAIERGQLKKIVT